MKHLSRFCRGKRLNVIWDNLNTHKDGKAQRWTTFNARHGGCDDFVYTPIHALWVNQIERWFSIIQRRLWRHGAFEYVGQLKDRLEGFIRWWNLNERKSTRSMFDHAQVVRRIARSIRHAELLHSPLGSVPNRTPLEPKVPAVGVVMQ